MTGGGTCLQHQTQRSSGFCSSCQHLVHLSEDKAGTCLGLTRTLPLCVDSQLSGLSHGTGFLQRESSEMAAPEGVGPAR